MKTRRKIALKIKNARTHYRSAFLIKQNQQKLIKLAKQNKRIQLKCTPLGTGHIEHYYHFIFDLVLPLSLFIKNTPNTSIFLIKSFGVLTPTLKTIFQDRVQIVDEFENENEKTHDLIGINPRLYKVKAKELNTLREIVFKNINFNEAPRPNKILLIERVAPTSYYLNEATRKGSGTSRRSIKNHEDVKDFLQGKISNNYEFENVALELLNFEEQVKLFNSAVLVIGQHGAGLSNIIWMHPESTIIEFGFHQNIHFFRSSEAMKHSHHILNFNEKHIKIDCNELENWLDNNIALAPYLKH